jgi:hypothetical protein
LSLSDCAASMRSSSVRKAIMGMYVAEMYVEHCTS